MGDTPRTDALCDVGANKMREFARTLERSLNSAGGNYTRLTNRILELERELAEARSEANRLGTLITDFTGGMQCDIRPHNPDSLIALKQEGYDIVKRRLSRVKGV